MKAVARRDWAAHSGMDALQVCSRGGNNGEDKFGLTQLCLGGASLGGSCRCGKKACQKKRTPWQQRTLFGVVRWLRGCWQQGLSDRGSRGVE